MYDWVQKGKGQAQQRQLAAGLGPSSAGGNEDRGPGAEDEDGDWEPVVIFHCEEFFWKIWEDVTQSCEPGVCVLGLMYGVKYAELLEVGLDGVVFKTDSLDELQQFQAMVGRGQASGDPTGDLGAPLAATSAAPGAAAGSAPSEVETALARKQGSHNTPSPEVATQGPTLSGGETVPGSKQGPHATIGPEVTLAGPALTGVETEPARKQCPGGVVPTPPGGASSGLELRWARVTRIQASGTGHRVCVDLCSLLPPNAGLLVGSFARGLFLVHSECLPSDFVPSRPFRVNAGPVCAYVALPGGATAYLSELQAGSEVLVVDAETGAATSAVVGRTKVEIRPMVLIEAEVEGEDLQEPPLSLTISLQNAETVRLIVPGTSSGSLSPGEAYTGAGEERGRTGLDGSHGPVGSKLVGSKSVGSKSVGSKSVSELQLGDRVLVQVMGEEGVARHTGIAVREYILEK